jgi:hypothetical protein
VIDPMTAMYAAVEATAEGKAAEIQLEWREVTDDHIDQPGTETTLTITIRREVKPVNLLAHQFVTDQREAGGDGGT